MLGKQGLRGLRTEVSEENNQCVDTGAVDVLNCLEHIQLVFDADRTFIDVTVGLGVVLDDCLAAAFGQAHREAVTADCDDTQLYFRNVYHE